MQASKRPEGAEEVLIELEDRRCTVCGTVLRYDYKSSGRSIRRLDKLLWVEVQIGNCPNGRCALKRIGVHPPAELAFASAYERFGTDVLAAIGQMRFEEKLPRDKIAARLKDEFDLNISPRTVERLFKLYGALVSGAHLKNPKLLRDLKKRKVMVLSIDAAEPIKGREPVWLLGETTTGWVLKAEALKSSRAVDLEKFLLPIRDFAKKHGIRIIGVISDAEQNIRAAVAAVFPGVPHQLCQIHYVKNVAKVLKREDADLFGELKKGARGLREVEREIRAGQENGSLEPDEASPLLDICIAMRSVLKDYGEPPFNPPGLLLFEQLVEIQKTVAEMARKKGGPF